MKQINKMEHTAAEKKFSPFIKSIKKSLFLDFYASTPSFSALALIEIEETRDSDQQI
jgi:hypothetical protein